MSKDRFGKLFSLYIAVCSLLIAISSGLSANNERLAVMHAIEASNQWAWYQAKATRLYLVVAEQDRQRYEGEKRALAESARLLERMRDRAMRLDAYFDLALMLLNGAAMTATAAFFFMGMGLAAISIALFTSGNAYLILALIL